MSSAKKAFQKANLGNGSCCKFCKHFSTYVDAQEVPVSTLYYCDLVYSKIIDSDAIKNREEAVLKYVIDSAIEPYCCCDFYKKE